MTFERMMYASGVGSVQITRDGRRILLSQREAEIRYWEEIGFAKAEARGRAYYVVQDWDGRLFATDDPHGHGILRVCPFLPSEN